MQSKADASVLTLLLFFRNSPLAGSLVPIGSESRQIRRLSARNICSDYHGREETIGIAKGGEFIIDNPIPCFLLPAEENAQTGTAFDFSHSAPLRAVGTQRLGLVCQRCYGRCQRWHWR